MKNVSFVFAISLLFLTASAFGQQNQNSNSNRNSTTDDNRTMVNMEQTLQMENDSRNDEVTLTIPENTLEMKVKIYGEISDGQMIIELYDPNGKKEGTFSLSTKGSPGKNANAMGTLSKNMKDPLSGDWLIKIMPKNVTGGIRIQSAYTQ